MDSIELRPLAAGDAAAVRDLLIHELGATPYAEASAGALTQALEAAATGTGMESRGLIAERDGEIVGLVLYGVVAGSAGAGKLHAVVVTASARLHGVGSHLCNASVAALAAHGARFVIAEVADDPRVAPGRALLAHTGFHEESRVPDYFADGVALAFLRRDVRT